MIERKKRKEKDMNSKQDEGFGKYFFFISCFSLEVIFSHV